MNNRDDTGRDNVASLDAARRRAAQKAKAAKSGAVMSDQPRSTRDLVVAGVILAFAIGCVVTLAVRATALIGGGGA